MSDTVRFAPNVAGSKIVPVSVRYGCNTMLLTKALVDVAVITRRCLEMRYSNVPPKVIVVGTDAVVVIVTDVADEVPLAFVAVTLKMYVPAAGAVVKLIDDAADGFAAAGVWVKTTAGPVPPVRAQVHVGAGSDALEALTVTVAPAVTVWFWIGLIVGSGVLTTVIVLLATATPQAFAASKFTLY